MGNKGRSETGFGGRINHFDEHGRKTGYSDPGFFGGYKNYDAKGHRTGRSDPSFWGGYNHYDSHGNKTGHSDPNGFGGFTHYDTHGNRTGRSDQSYPGHYENSNGCYIATCVYGSYNCPEVWTLRRFRDNTLAASAPGRAFIRIYYGLSPRLVARYGEKTGFRRFWKKHLDRLVRRLRDNGVADSPYEDRKRRK